jgi:hypothetical protein
MKVFSAYIRGSDIYSATLAKSIFGIFQDIEPFQNFPANFSPGTGGERLAGT